MAIPTCTSCAQALPHDVSVYDGFARERTEVAAVITTAITAEHLRQAAGWVPELKLANTPDCDWDWMRLLGGTVGDPSTAGICRFEDVALVVGEKVQGLVILQCGQTKSKADGAALLYVEYLAVAPQNRKRLHNPTRYRHCGLALVEYARHRSGVLGLQGRVGLHSVTDPYTEAFYRALGMIDYGPDAAEGGLRYFEFAANT